LTSLHLVPADITASYEVHEWRNACAVLRSAYPAEWNEVLTMLRGFTLAHTHIMVGGGGRSQVSAALDGHFYRLGWREDLQQLFRDLGVYGKYGASTTHMSKLLPRLEGGSGGGCPILVFGIKRSLYDPDA
jgi:hypothetical protein